MASKKCKCCHVLPKLYGQAFCNVCSKEGYFNGHKHHTAKCGYWPAGLNSPRYCDPNIQFYKLMMEQSNGS